MFGTILYGIDELGSIVIKHVKSNEQWADKVTKALHRVKFGNMRKLFGVKNLPNV